MLRNYAGLTKRRFLMDIQDILKFQEHAPLLNLDSSSCSISFTVFNSLQEGLLSGVPLAVLMGKAEFMGRNFYVNKHVLIPRPETELLADMVLSEFKGKLQNVLDIGTGSGVLLLSLLAGGAGVRGLGVDISEEALKVAEINAHRQRIDADFILSDRFQKVEGKFDLIISNPPYIKMEAHRHLIHPGISHEPQEALYLPDDEYEQWFRELFQGVRKHLAGTFFMEGHEVELTSQAGLLQETGLRDVQVLKDLTGRDRFLRASI